MNVPLAKLDGQSAVSVLCNTLVYNGTPKSARNFILQGVLNLLMSSDDDEETAGLQIQGLPQCKISSKDKGTRKFKTYLIFLAFYNSIWLMPQFRRSYRNASSPWPLVEDSRVPVGKPSARCKGTRGSSEFLRGSLGQVKPETLNSADAMLKAEPIRGKWRDWRPICIHPAELR